MRINNVFDSFGLNDILVRSYKHFFEIIKPNSQEIAQNSEKHILQKGI